MSIRNILKPKSKEQTIEDFCKNNKISAHEFKKFNKKLRFIYVHKLFVWVACLLGCIFGLSMIINGIIAMAKKFFWFPVHEAKSMISFFNVFWAITWYALGIVIIFYFGGLLAKMEEND